MSPKKIAQIEQHNLKYFSKPTRDYLSGISSKKHTQAPLDIEGDYILKKRGLKPRSLKEKAEILQGVVDELNIETKTNYHQIQKPLTKKSDNAFRNNAVSIVSRGYVECVGDEDKSKLLNPFKNGHIVLKPEVYINGEIQKNKRMHTELYY